jgi:hypothetical protein
MAPFAYAEKQAAILFRLIFLEKNFVRPKNKLKITDYKPAERGQFPVSL